MEVGNPKESIDTLFKLVNLARLLDSSLIHNNLLHFDRPAVRKWNGKIQCTTA